MRPAASDIGSAAGPVADRYDAVLIDLDGVVYRGDRVVPGAGAAVEALRRRSIPVLFLTNNSARTPDQVADKLRAVGIEADPAEVLTSAMATAAMLRREERPGRTAFVIGERGVRTALEQAGVELVDGDPDRTDLVVVGWDRHVDYAKLRRASLLVGRGARLVATNADASYPAPDGLWPGAGALLAVVTTATGATPTIVGKPGRPMFDAAVEMTRATRPLMVGDRLDTDISGATGMGFDSLLVFSGAATPRDLVEAADLPTYVGPDLSVILEDRRPGRFRTAEPAEVPGIRKLLQEAGLSEAGAEDRVGSTVVTGEGPEGPDATACLEDVGGFGLLRSVAVRPARRGEGLGMLAVAAAIREGRARGVRHVSLFTESAPGFFERLGFRLVDRGDLPAPVASSAQAAEECAATAVAMVLNR